MSEWKQVKEGCSHRSGALPAGSIFRASRVEIEAFGDKFVDPSAEALARFKSVMSARPTATRDLDDNTPASARIDATEAAVKLAAEHGLNLDTVQGTGRDGRVLKADVEAHLEITAEDEG